MFWVAINSKYIIIINEEGKSPRKHIIVQVKFSFPCLCSYNWLAGTAKPALDNHE